MSQLDSLVTELSYRYGSKPPYLKTYAQNFINTVTPDNMNTMIGSVGIVALSAFIHDIDIIGAKNPGIIAGNFFQKIGYLGYYSTYHGYSILGAILIMTAGGTKLDELPEAQKMITSAQEVASFLTLGSSPTDVADAISSNVSVDFIKKIGYQQTSEFIKSTDGKNAGEFLKAAGTTNTINFIKSTSDMNSITTLGGSVVGNFIKNVSLEFQDQLCKTSSSSNSSSLYSTGFKIH